ncbi:uncharacterized protein EKO05_0002337 [Ascochyta rabiei]|uniref:Uncharacterized protein n=1 Tax=Didymella rabiei TaxID=5454 RepID=A0A162VP98_DIDRA|nr:uncharacterized protein EKO05_0002337 [Ascochyta rabiei]KZM18560.1 hypothetical protein ST47_g10325 [Ascochyta rabiei]UPX11746.1 hypothetical protein EKO05_0002337 [Ascochyta rabiei]
MRFSGTGVLYTALLLVTSVNSLKFDKACNTKYGKLTAKQLIDKSIDFQPKLAKAGVDGLDAVIEVLKYQSETPGAKKPTGSKKELDRIIATYRILFGDIMAKNDDGTPNPNFKSEAADHIAAMKTTRDTLNRMSKPGSPDLIIHCNDDWLSERGPKSMAASKPTAPATSGSQYFYDTDRNRWVSVKGGKPCQGDKAVVTSANKKLSGTSREKGPERITFCPSYLRRQHQLEKDKQSHLWDIPTTKLPDTFTTYTAAGKKDKTLPFHISAFGSKIVAKWFHESMRTELFDSNSNNSSDKKISGSGTSSLAYGFDGAVNLVKQKEGKNVAESSLSIDNILYWCLALYYDKWLWSTGKPEDPSVLSTAPAKVASVDEGFQVEAAAKKGGSKKTKEPADQPKTEASPPKTEAPVDTPKTDKPADPPKTSAVAAPLPPSSQGPSSSPPSSQAALPASSEAPPPTNNPTPSASIPQTNQPLSTQLPQVSAPVSPSNKPASSLSTPLSGIVSMSRSVSMTKSVHTSCSNTLCTLPSSSASPTSSGAVPQETFESEPMNAGSMTAGEIAAVAAAIASEQVAAMALWDQVLTDMGLPSETIQGDPSASMGTGLPMATGGAGGAMNGTWAMPTLKTREGRYGVRERRMYDFAS